MTPQHVTFARTSLNVNIYNVNDICNTTNNDQMELYADERNVFVKNNDLASFKTEVE